MKKLIICIDGLGKDLISKENTPFLYQFGKENYSSELETLFAFTGLEYSFFSGKFPREHGTWLEFVRSKNSIFKNPLLKFLSFNKKIRDYFGVLLQKFHGRTWFSGLHHIPLAKLKYFDTSVKQGLWKLNYFQERNFVCYKWPFFVIKNNDNEKIKLIFDFEDDDKRLGRLISEKDFEVYYTQLMEIDKIIHKFGRESPQTKVVLKKIDKLLEKYVGGFEGEVFLWSDHGFVDIKNYIDIEKILPKRKDYIYFIAGTTVSFWFGNKDVEKIIKRILKKTKVGQILDDKTAEKYKIPLDKKYGDLIFYIKKGNYFFPNFYQRNSDEKFVAMHGYPNDKELNGFLISNERIPTHLKFNGVLKWLK